MGTRDPISMYVPARNAEATLADCIASIREQTRAPDELFILADPRSGDRTMEVARETGLPVIVQQGDTLGAARNEAILHARHRWLASCDSDVVLEPEWLERLAARREEQVAGIQGCTRERVLSPADAWRALHMPHHWGDAPLRNPFMLVSEVIFDRNALLAVGGYRDDLNYYEDSDLCQRLRDAGFDLFYEPAAAATHYRSDDTLSLLNLRWKYSEYRQKQHMDRYAGLIRKLDINREYALTTLARSLARGCEELIYLSLLLYFHHLVMDLKSLHSRRPLLSPEDRRRHEVQILNAAIGVLDETHGILGQAVRRDLAQWSGDPGPSEAGTVPVWSDHVDATLAKVCAFCRELSRDLLDLLACSAQHVHGACNAVDVPRWTRPDTRDLQRRIDALPTSEIVNPRMLRDIEQIWPETGKIQPLTHLTGAERNALSSHDHITGRPVALAAHLEKLADPRSIFREARDGEPSAARYHHLVVCYQPPSRFLPGADVLSAADLASSAASAGWTIDRFDTFVGSTRLMLRRTPGV